MNFETVIEFEKKIAEFFGAPFAVAVDSCTHGIELCLRYQKANVVYCPRNTYLSIPMLAYKLNIALGWYGELEWTNYYSVYRNIYDAAVFWEKDGYKKVCRDWINQNEICMCLSFQYQKHLSLGRGGMILCATEKTYNDLKKMSYDGRLPNIPWREQNVDMIGYHYYMTPEIAALGLEKLQEAIKTPPRLWTVNDWPDLTKMDIFQ